MIKENTNNNLKIFNFNNQKVRSEIINNEPYFCASDICKILEIKNGADILNKRIKNKYIEKIYIPHPQSKIKEIKMSFVNEAGLYELIFCSNKKEADLFKEWIFEEVLPRIRKTGKYEIQANQNKYINATRKELLLLALEQEEEKEKLLLENKKQKNIIEEYEVKEEKTIMETSKLLNTKPSNFISFLKDRGYLYKSKKKLVPTQYGIDTGFFTSKVYRTEFSSYISYYITKKGFTHFLKFKDLIKT